MKGSATGRRLLLAVVAALTLGVVAWLGWRMVVGSPSGPGAAAASAHQEAGELVPLAPEAGVELRFLGWQHSPAAAGAASDSAGSAVAVATLRNVDSRWTEFIVDVAAIAPENSQILGFGSAQVSDLQPGGLGAFTLTIPTAVPVDARLGVANVWGRTPGDPQIHPINFAASPDAGGQSVVAQSGAAANEVTEADLMVAASQFAVSLATMQQACRADDSLAGLVCLSRRNFPDYLLEPQARDVIAGRPFFHQEVDPSGPPRAFDLTASDDVVACVGQRIDKQTSDQVAILGSCSQRGLYPGDGEVKSPVVAASGLPPIPAAATRSSTPVGPGGLPGAPVAGPRPPVANPLPPTIGDPVTLGDLTLTVDGVQVGMGAVSGLPPANGTFTLVSVTVINGGADAIDLASYRLNVDDTAGSPLALVVDAGGSAVGWPPEPKVLPPGAGVNTTVVVDLVDDQTAATATLIDLASGQQVSVGLLPPPV